MTKKLTQADRAAIKTARQMFEGPLQGQFAVLASRSANARQRRAAYTIATT